MVQVVCISTTSKVTMETPRDSEKAPYSKDTANLNSSNLAKTSSKKKKAASIHLVLEAVAHVLPLISTIDRVLHRIEDLSTMRRENRAARKVKEEEIANRTSSILTLQVMQLVAEEVATCKTQDILVTAVGDNSEATSSMSSSKSSNLIRMNRSNQASQVRLLPLM